MENMEMRQRDHMQRRNYGIHADHERALLKQYGLSSDYPKSPLEMVKFIKEGKYVLPDRDYDSYEDDGFVQFIEWRDPAIVRDEEGLAVARKALTLEHTRVNDVIILLPLEEAVKEFEGFKTWTYKN